MLLDERWLQELLGTQRPRLASVPPEPVEQTRSSEQVGAQPARGPQVDWGDALDVPSFYGREEELATLEQWAVQERCRVVSVLGMGGIGKSALAVQVMHRLADQFDVVIFRSLRDSPSCEALLDACLRVLTPQPLSLVPVGLESRISRLLEHLRSSRLLRRLAETAHQSCLLLTSREKLAELRALEGSRSPVRALRLIGLEVAACEPLLAEHELVGSPEEQARLVERYAGNPLALQIVAETIADLFSGAIDPFLAEGTTLFGGITELLDEQWARLSPLEQTVLSWLAIMREPVTLEDLLSMLVSRLSRGQVLEAVDGLRRRSLIERGQRAGSFTVQSVVLEYVTAVLIAQAASDIEQGTLARLVEHDLERATAREDVRQTQRRLLVAPLLAQVRRGCWGREEVEVRLLSQLNQLRTRTDEAQGYGPANVLALLHEHRGHVRGLDLSQLVLRGAYLQGVEMQDATLSGALMRECVFTENFDAIIAVAIGSTGQYWAAGSRRGEVRVWREAGQILHLVWQAHTDIVTSLAFSPDERTLASGSFDGSVTLWNVASGVLLWSGWHTDNIFSVAFSPDGSLLASGSNDAAVRLWDPLSGRQLQTLSHPDPVFAVSWSPDGHLLASGGFDGHIRLWEMQKTQPARCVQTLEGHSNRVRGLAFAPDGSVLASASWDGTVKLWEVGEVRSQRVRQTLVGHTERVHRVAWSPDGGTLASGSFDHTIWLWDGQEGSARVALQGHSALVNGLAFTPDSRHLLSSSEDGTLRLWDVESSQCVRVLQGYAASLSDVDWSPDGTQLASGGSDTVVTLWEPATGTCVQILRDLDHRDTIFFGMAWSPDGRLLASGAYQQGVQVWDVTKRDPRLAGRAYVTWTRRVAWSPDGTRLVGGGEDGHVYVWDASDGTQFLQLPGHHGIVTSVAWSPDGTRLASGGGSRDGGELFVWDAHSGERVHAFEGHPGVVFALTWALSGELVLSGGSDGRVRWWEVHSGECVREREAHQGTVQALKVSPDGRFLASCGDDGAITLWDLERGEHLRTLRRDRPYERLNITGIRGLTQAQKATLHALGAVEDAPVNST